MIINKPHALYLQLKQRNYELVESRMSANGLIGSPANFWVVAAVPGHRVTEGHRKPSRSDTTFPHFSHTVRNSLFSERRVSANQRAGSILSHQMMIHR